MPKVHGGPKALNDLLEGTFNGCVRGGGSDSQCSAVAWANAKRQGWHKDRKGNWVKKVLGGVFKGVLGGDRGKG